MFGYDTKDVRLCLLGFSISQPYIKTLRNLKRGTNEYLVRGYSRDISEETK